MNITIYHNPRCSKSRATLALLEQRGIEPRVVEYLEHPPSAEELDRILRLLGCEPRELARTKEEDYRIAGLDDPGLSRAEQIARMVAHPRTIERPIVVAGERAAVGRPPSAVAEMLDSLEPA